METELTRPETIDTVLRIVSWCVIGFAAIWFVTSVIGFFHRRAYNLTHAESGPSRPITPDFLKVDKAKRDAAIARGEAYEKVLDTREAPAPKTVKKVASWSRIFATGAALIGLFTTVIGAIAQVESYQERLENYSSWDRLVDLATQNPIGTTVTLAVIAANIYLVVKKIQKPE